MKNVFRALLIAVFALAGAESALPQAQVVNIKQFGAIGDGQSHPLSQFYSTLAAAQAVYPFVDDLTQEIDWAAAQSAIDYSYAHGGNQTVYCPGTTVYQGFYTLSQPLYLDPPTNFRAQNNLPRWSSGNTYPLFAEVLYNGVPYASMAAGNIGATPTFAPGYPNDFRIPAVLSGPAASPAPFADVTISNASPAVITLTGHGLAAGTPIRFIVSAFDNTGTITGALPTGISANTAYYILSTGLTANTFEVSATPGGAAINTSSAGVGQFGISTQLWGIDTQPPGDFSFANRDSFTGDEGLPGNWGCRFLSRSPIGPAFIIGPNSGNIISNVQFLGPGYPSVQNDLRCQHPDTENTVLYPGGAFPMAGMLAISVGGGASRTTFNNVGTYGFYYGYVNGPNGNQSLVDQNTWNKSGFSESCVGMEFKFNDQGFINSVYEIGGGTNTLGISAASQAGINLFGGNFSNNYNEANVFAVTGVSVSGTQATMTVTTPDRFLQHPLCSLSLQCVYNAWIIRTPHFGLVSFVLTGWNPFTKQLSLTTDPKWSNPWSDQGLEGAAQWIADIQGATQIDAAEVMTHFFGNGIEVRDLHLEDNNTPSPLLHAGSTFGGGKPDTMANILFNTGITLGAVYSAAYPDGPGTTCPSVNTPVPTITTAAQCKTIEANFFAMQTQPFIWMDGADVILDGNIGGFDAIPERAIIQQGGGPTGGSGTGQLEVRHSNGVGINIASWVPFHFRGSDQFSTSTFTGTGSLSIPAYTRDSTQALGMGLWDSAVSFLPAVRALTSSPGAAGIDTSWRGNGWGESPNWGVRPAPWASPCITPAQATTLAGALPSIVYAASVDHMHTSSGGTGYQVNDVVTMVGGTSTAAAQIQVLSVTSGAISTYQFNTGGNYTTIATSFTSSGGHGTGATFNNVVYDLAAFPVNYPLLWGGTIYHKCDWLGSSQTKYALESTNTGYSYFQNLTTTNIPNLSWSTTVGSPFVYMNREALEVMFPGLVFSLVGTGGCTGTTAVLMVTEVHINLGYVSTVNAAQDGPPSTPPFTSNCTGTLITMAPPNLVNPY